MKKNQVDAILINQAKRRNTVFAFICAIIIAFILSFSMFLIYKQRSKAQYVSYKETSNIDYKVYLKENDFFDNTYLTSNKQYIASLIDYIDANFKYNLSLEEKEVEYKYSYKIEAYVDVKHKDTGNSLYTTNKELVAEKEYETDEINVTIDEKINIDYNYYNNIIKRFIQIYDLNDIDSTLKVNMYINVIGSCEEFEETKEQESVMTLSIPLTTKTVAIDLSNDLIDTENNLMQCKSTGFGNIIFLVLFISFLIIGVALIIITIRYEIETRTAEDIYERELKKILNNYSSYIQTLSSDFDFKNYQLLRLDTFEDMLEIRDTIRQPILMKESIDKSGAYFLIPSNTKILYVYRLKLSNIRREMKNKKEIDEI